MFEIRLLGPVEFVVAGRVVELGPPKRKLVFAALAVDAGRPVPVEVLVDRVWDEKPPAEARGALYAHVARIRKVLAAARETGDGQPCLVRHAGGYRLEVAADRVDLHRFGDLARRARRPDQDDRQRVDALREALALWRGNPLAGLAGSWVSEVREACHRERVDVLIAWGEVELRLGHQEAVISRVRQELRDHPMVEPLTAVLMRALHAAGRTSEAVAHYAELRRRLADELGVIPGAELRQLHQDVLRGDTTPRPTDPALGSKGRTSRQTPLPSLTPAQLPAEVLPFVGRVEQLHQLGAPGSGAVVVSTISGTAGVGKTALAVHWAHRVAERFPDGQLYVDMRGFDPSGRLVAPADAVRGFLDALGVPPERVPGDLGAQTALYRSLIAGKRMLILLDNARDAEQVRSLLPGSGTVRTLVTSRNQLTGMIALDGAHPLLLDLFSPQEARDLLGCRVGHDRVAAQPAEADRIIASCARLPLAIAIAAAHVQERGLSLAELADELADAGDWLDVLDAGEPAAQIRAVLSASYRALTPPAARLFRLVGTHPGPDSSVAALASLVGEPVADTRRTLVELVRANLLVEHRPGRFTCHDLLHAYAADLADDPANAAEREVAITRLLDHYLTTAHSAARVLNPHRDPLPLPPPRLGVTPERLDDYDQALTWFVAEHAVLVAAVAHAAYNSRHTHAWQLAWTLTTFLDRQGHWRDWVTVLKIAVASADRLDAPAAQALTHRLLANAYIRSRSPDEAHTHLTKALDLLERTGDQTDQAATHHSVSELLTGQGRHAEALRHIQQAGHLYQITGSRRGQALSLSASGWLHAMLGDYQQGVDACQRALHLLREIDDRFGEAATLDSLGYIHHQLGDPAHALTYYRRAFDLYRSLGDRFNEADTMTRLGDIHQAGGQVDAARSHWRRALAILDDLGHPDAQHLRDKLDAPGHDG